MRSGSLPSTVQNYTLHIYRPQLRYFTVSNAVLDGVWLLWLWPPWRRLHFCLCMLIGLLFIVLCVYGLCTHYWVNLWLNGLTKNWRNVGNDQIQDFYFREELSLYRNWTFCLSNLCLFLYSVPVASQYVWCPELNSHVSDDWLLCLLCCHISRSQGKLQRLY